MMQRNEGESTVEIGSISSTIYPATSLLRRSSLTVAVGREKCSFCCLAGEGHPLALVSAVVVDALLSVSAPGISREVLLCCADLSSVLIN